MILRASGEGERAASGAVEGQSTLVTIVALWRRLPLHRQKWRSPSPKTWRIWALTLLFAAPAHAVLPDEMLGDPALEARARMISQGLRCVVCQNQDIDTSDAPLARDLRLLVRERLVKGDSDAAATDYVVARYGHFVLLKPPMEAATWLLWLGPFAVLGIGGAALTFWLRGRHPVATLPLSEAEAREITAMDDRERGG